MDWPPSGSSRRSGNSVSTPRRTTQLRTRRSCGTAVDATGGGPVLAGMPSHLRGHGGSPAGIDGAGIRCARAASPECAGNAAGRVRGSPPKPPWLKGADAAVCPACGPGQRFCGWVRPHSMRCWPGNPSQKLHQRFDRRVTPRPFRWMGKAQPQAPVVMEAGKRPAAALAAGG